MIAGAPGSGKTNWAVPQLIKGGAYYRRVFGALHVVMPLNSLPGELRQGPIRKAQLKLLRVNAGSAFKVLVDVEKTAALCFRFLASWSCRLCVRSCGEDCGIRFEALCHVTRNCQSNFTVDCSACDGIGRVNVIYSKV